MESKDFIQNYFDGEMSVSPAGEPKIFTVTELTASIKMLLENQFESLWVKGEISNLRIPASGHAYFTLKDDSCQLQGVMFRGRFSQCKIDLKDGKEVRAFGKITVYESRGNYQILVEKLQEAGAGALKERFDKLKKKLEEKGYFAPGRKRPIPKFPPCIPVRIGIVTSLTGAAIKDMLKVLSRRNPWMSLVLAPAKVQGEGAALEIAQKIVDLNAYHAQNVAQGLGLDFLIIGRGGGSLEDLWAFNEEAVGDAIFNSTLPIVSAVGHEIDYTISDWVADLRAPTPSAAAEMAAPHSDEVFQYLKLLHHRLDRLSPQRKIDDSRLHLADRLNRLDFFLTSRLKQVELQVNRIYQRLTGVAPESRLGVFKETLKNLNGRREQAIERKLLLAKSTLQRQGQTLEALSPKNILNRGYSITRDPLTKKIFRFAREINPGQPLEIMLHEGVVSASAAGPSGEREKVDKSDKKPKDSNKKPPGPTKQGQLF